MGPRTLVLTGLSAFVVATGCGGNSPAPATAPAPQPDPSQYSGSPAPAAGPRNTDWPIFGVRADRANVHGVGANASRLRRIVIHASGTVDSSPIYLHAVTVRGARRDAFVATTTYGRTLAIDARNGRILWTFTPRGIGGW